MKPNSALVVADKILRVLRLSSYRSLGVHYSRIRRTGLRNKLCSTVWQEVRLTLPRYAGELLIRLLASYGRNKERCLLWALLDIAVIFCI